MTHIAPHDISDLLLAPLALRLDQELEAVSGLTAEELHLRVCLTTDRDPRTTEQRRRLLLEMLERYVDTHAWRLSWGARGLVLSHDHRQIVLGVPDNVRRFVAE